MKFLLSIIPSSTLEYYAINVTGGFFHYHVPTKDHMKNEFDDAVATSIIERNQSITNQSYEQVLPTLPTKIKHPRYN